MSGDSAANPAAIERLRSVPDGRLVAAVLSVYDLPHDVQPSSVSLTVLGTTVTTGPPCARHRDRNSFKFADGSKSSSPSANELVVSAPLSELYPSVARFTCHMTGKPDIVAKCSLSQTLRIGDQQWLILQLSDPSSPDAPDNDEKDSVQPTLRVKLLLVGSYRPEINALISASQSWFSTVDGIADAGGSAISSVMTELPEKIPAVKYLLVPTVPLAAVSVALVPCLIGALVVGLPFFLPLLAVVAAFVATVGAIGGTLFISTRTGRERLSPMLSSAYSAFLHTAAGQRLVYDTGPRPSPKALAQALLPKDLMAKLIICLAIDFVGSASYLLPGVGETFDVAWAPIQYVLIAAMFDHVERVSPNLKYVSFVEEILPFTDFIPSATYGWICEFGPMIVGESGRKIQDLAVVIRGEREALEETVRGAKIHSA